MRKFSTNLFLTSLFLCFTVVAFSQGVISGKIIDSESGEGIAYANILVKGTGFGAVTDINGAFSIQNVDAGTQTVVISYVGYVEAAKEAVVTDGQTTDLGTIQMNSSTIGIQAVEVIASVARDRRTPVAVSTIKGEEVAKLVGNQEYPEVLRSTPSIYVTKQGGGFGDSRINVRGFDQRNTAVMLNGIPVNDMENGWVYWSNWAGLSDVTSTLQVQRGLGASKLAVPSVGGSINIVTNAADFKKGGAVGVSIGNDGYQKYSAVLSSGVMDNGFAITGQFTHTRGNGYVDGTTFRAYSYFLSANYKINESHSISATVLGAPQWHHQRIINTFDPITLETYVGEDHAKGGGDDHPRGIRYNQFWGELNGEEFTWRKNFYHKPKGFINHYWDINEKTDLKTSVYYSRGLGGGTGPRGRLSNFIFDSDSRTRDDRYGADHEGQVRFDDYVTYHQGGNIPDFEPNDSDPGTTTSSGDGAIRRASMNYHTWYGALSTLTTELSENLTLVGGVDLRYYYGEHFRRLENLLGNTEYVSRSNDNNPNNVITETAPADFGNFLNDSYKTSNNVLNYWNDGLVSWLGLFGQLEYTNDKLSAFLSLSGSNQGFKRVDYFNYLDSDPEQTTDWQNFTGGTAKLGINYNLDEMNNIFINAGMFSRQPIFDNVFMNFRNDINPDTKNQRVRALEAGYGYKSGQFKLNANVYATIWDNRQFSSSFNGYEYVFNGDSLNVDAVAIFSNVGQTHTGVEIEASYRPNRQLTISGMASFGNWIYSSNFETQLTDLDNNRTIDNITLFTDGVKVGDAAQSTINLRVSYEPIEGLRVFGNFYNASNLFAQFSILDDQFFDADFSGDKVFELPSYSLIDAGIFYDFKFGDLDMSLKLVVNNVADTWYVSELVTNNLEDRNGNPNTIYDNKGFFGFGRTWNAGVKVRF